MIKNLIWDFDGTLCNTYPSIIRTLKASLKDFGYIVDEKEILSKVKITLGEAFDYYSNKYKLGEKLSKRFAQYTRLPKERPPYNFVVEVCELIIDRNGANYIITHRDRKSTFEILNYYGLATFFEEIITADDGFAKKPDSEAFNYLIKKYGLNRDETLGIGDRELDIKAAKNAGIKSCYFDEFGMPTETKPDLEINSFLELLQLLENGL
ncbi:MAG: phosphatase [Thermotogae bacterium]|uniref:HAD-IA family hydrolase n=1 Tax=Kosmotoga sp. TaxID=1955248 RepID=UPI000F2ABFE1|nr:HAD-IA family hydrolase [Kosmotoga sp.]MBO8167470.1 HAD-IA family hydrolase [Kosmotoga sp.]MCD6159847.1 HAD-IA family hydrolase [Kosmotoga sp.]RKX47391.1 MAG: phosphatase [Thermotogota bacterium]